MNKDGTITSVAGSPFSPGTGGDFLGTGVVQAGKRVFVYAASYDDGNVYGWETQFKRLGRVRRTSRTTSFMGSRLASPDFASATVMMPAVKSTCSQRSRNCSPRRIPA